MPNPRSTTAQLHAEGQHYLCSPGGPGHPSGLTPTLARPEHRAEQPGDFAGMLVTGTGEHRRYDDRRDFARTAKNHVVRRGAQAPGASRRSAPLAVDGPSSWHAGTGSRLTPTPLTPLEQAWLGADVWIYDGTSGDNATGQVWAASPTNGYLWVVPHTATSDNDARQIHHSDLRRTGLSARQPELVSA